MTTSSSPEQETLLPVDVVASRFNVSDKTIRRWIKEKHLPCVLVGPAKRIRVPESAVNALLKNGTKDDKDAQA